MKRKIAYLLFAVSVAGLARADQTVQSVQQALKDQGFYYGNVTGDKSAETTAAVRRYQIRNGLKVTGDAQRVPSATFNCNRGCHRPAVSTRARLTRWEYPMRTWRLCSQPLASMKPGCRT